MRLSSKNPIIVFHHKRYKTPEKHIQGALPVTTSQNDIFWKKNYQILKFSKRGNHIQEFNEISAIIVKLQKN